MSAQIPGVVAGQPIVAAQTPALSMPTTQAVSQAMASGPSLASMPHVTFADKMNAVASLYFVKDAADAMRMRDTAAYLCQSYTVDVPESYKTNVLAVDPGSPYDADGVLSAHADFLRAAHHVFAGHCKVEIDAKLGFKHLDSHEWIENEKLATLHYVDLVSLGLLPFDRADRLLDVVIAEQKKGKARVDYALDQGTAMSNPFFFAFRVGLYAFATPAIVRLTEKVSFFQWQNDIWSYDSLSAISIAGMLLGLDMLITSANKDIRSAKRVEAASMDEGIAELKLVKERLGALRPRG